MKFHFPRASFVRKGAVKVASKKSSAVAYLSDIAGSERCCAVGFVGKADRPAFNFSFRSADVRARWVAGWFVRMDDAAAHRAKLAAERKAKLAAPHGLKVGDVLYTSWGYDQTNIDYYQVVELVGKRSVVIREISCEVVETGYMQGKSVPAVGVFKGEPMLKKVSEHDTVRIASYASASKLDQVIVDGVAVGYKPKHWTAYA
jgi:hypothetical protein